MSSHLTSASLVLPPQVYSEQPVRLGIRLTSDAAVSITALVNAAASQEVGAYYDIGTANDEITGYAFTAAASVVKGCPMTFSGDSSPVPLSVPIAPALQTSDGYLVTPTAGTITLVNPRNVGQLPLGVPGTPTAQVETITPTTTAVVTYLPSQVGSGDPYSGGSTSITGYYVQAVGTGAGAGARSTAQVSCILFPAHSFWAAITTGCSLTIDSTNVVLPTSGTPSVAALVTLINTTTPVSGVKAYAIGTAAAATEQLLLVSTNATLTLTDGGLTTNAFTVLGWSATPPTTVVGGTATCVTAAVSAWHSITTSANLNINGYNVSLGTSGTPVAITLAGSINSALAALVATQGASGVVAYAQELSTASAAKIQFIATPCTANPSGSLTITDGGGVTNGLYVLGYGSTLALAQAASPVLGYNYGVITGLTTATAYKFYVFPVSSLGNGPKSTDTASLTMS